MAETTITTFVDAIAALATQSTDKMNTQMASLGTGDMGPSSMLQLMGATSEFQMSIEAMSGCNKAFCEGVITPARKIG